MCPHGELQPCGSSACRNRCVSHPPDSTGGGCQEEEATDFDELAERLSNGAMPAKGMINVTHATKLITDVCKLSGRLEEQAQAVAAKLLQDKFPFRRREHPSARKKKEEERKKLLDLPSPPAIAHRDSIVRSGPCHSD